MKIILEINNKTEYAGKKEFFLAILKRTLDLAAIVCLEDKEIELSLALVGEDEIRVLNEKYRSKSKATDVLSFAEYENRAELCAQKKSNLNLGELIVAPDFVAKSAAEQGFSLENELIYIVSHGILHLLGYDHEEEMFDIQQQVVNKIIEK